MTQALESTAMALLQPLTPVCGDKPLKLDQACLHVTNLEEKITLELWAQSTECYKCPLWKYVNLPADSTQELQVNATYPTQLYFKTPDEKDVQNITYHFGEYGAYHLEVSTTNITGMSVLAAPHNETLPLIIAVVFFSMLVFMWQCCKLLMRRMDSSSDSPYAEITSGPNERSPLLSLGSESGSVSAQLASLSTSPPPSQSSPSSSVLPGAMRGQCPIPDTRRSGGRLLSLDTFRGLAIVIMIFVNYGGGGYYFFKHARWNGLTVADLVFPWFLWIMGVSLVFSTRSQLRRATKRYVMVLRILKRCLILFALGIIINSEGHGHNYLPTFRILGVLQRFAICYFINAVMEVYLMHPQESPQYVWYWHGRDIVRSWAQWLITLVLVAVHTAFTFGFQVPGCPKGYLGPGGLHDGGKHWNCTGGAAGYLDNLLLGSNHVYSHPTCRVVYDGNTPYDPEGLLGALTSVLMVQFGVAAGRIITTYQDHNARIKRWLVWGVVTGFLAGCLCFWRKEGGLIPVNKNLWSLSFILCTACFAFILLSFFYLLIDKCQWWSGNPLRYAGMNAIVLYVGHEICGSLLPFSWQPVGQYHAYPLAMNLWGASLWVAIAYALHLKKVYISV